MAGTHRSPFHGFSVEFAEHREYVPGDDLRYVDWKVYGRTDKIYLKQYEEETNQVCYLVLDISASMQYQGEESALSKLEYAQCVAAVLAHLVIGQQDNIGLMTFDTAVRELVPDTGNPADLKQLWRAMQQGSVIEKTDLGATLHEVASRLRRRGLVLVLSDLFDNEETLASGLKHLRHSRQDVIVFHILDPAELSFPFRDATLFQGLEGEPDVLTDPRALRKAYLQTFQSFLKRVERACRGEDVDYQMISTDQRLDIALGRYLTNRSIQRPPR